MQKKGNNNKKVKASTTTPSKNKVVTPSNLNVKKNRNGIRAKKSIIAFGLCAILLVVSTYAWFIGMKTVNVSSFNVSIAAIDGLSLSLNGEDDSWTDEIIINETNYKNDAYEGNTNTWSKGGLIPMSTVGKINEETSRLILYEKGSFTATSGGYRVMASKVLNEGTEEAKGYVAFDLFIKNKSGNKYYETVNEDNEEAIYLIPESKVKVSAMGDNEDKAGIENSVRVAFAQIGRVEANSDADTIVDITCETTGDVLGICSDRGAQIWEPNDKRHVKNAINWYSTSCKKRIGSDLTKASSYSGSCKSFSDGEYVPTYAVAGEIEAEHRVDSYDGTEFNGYTASISNTIQDGKLYKFPYFTDTMKDLEGTARPTFMTLAPNSVTKVRIYVYLEGQDVDNYEFASLGKKVSVSFGFSKERFYGEDVEYNEGEEKGPELDPEVQQRPRLDSAANIISELCEDEETCLENDLYKDPYGNIRYVGSNPDNYISFNGETWRIVGVFNVANKKNGRLLPRIKIVRSEPFSTLMSWDSSSDGTIDGQPVVAGGMGFNQWGESDYSDGRFYEGSDIMRLLNTYYLGTTNVCNYCNDSNQMTCPIENDCSSSVKQLDANALKAIDNTIWYLGGRSHAVRFPASTVYNAERGTTSGKICPSTSASCNDNVNRTLTWLGKVGLLYPSDYGYASKNETCKNDLYGSDSTCDQENWLHPSSGEYWTIMPYANATYAVNVYGISSANSLSHYTAYSPRSIWPTVYLKYGTKIIGTGQNNSDAIFKIVE